MPIVRNESSLFDGFFGLGGDGVRCLGRLIDLFCDALHTILEAFEAFAETFAQLRQLFAAEEDKDNYGDDDEMCWCK
jgi:hypothetical protein